MDAEPVRYESHQKVPTDPVIGQNTERRPPVHVSPSSYRSYVINEVVLAVHPRLAHATADPMTYALGGEITRALYKV